MTQYLVAVHRPNEFDHSASIDDGVRRDIDVLNEEMEAAGVRVFVGGLRPPSTAKSLRVQNNGDIHINEGPCVATTDFVDGFWVLKCADFDEVISWGRKAALACRAAVEVRPFY
jgi:hypothetical protein